MTTWEMRRESREWLGPIEVHKDGVRVSAFEVAVVGVRARPVEADWKLAQPLYPGGEAEGLGLMIGEGTDSPLAIGTFQVHVRVKAGPEQPIIDNVGVVVVN